MIDMNQILTQLMGGGGKSGAGPAQESDQRIWPVSTDTGQSQLPGQSQGGGGLLGQLGALGIGAAAGGLAGSLLGSKKIRQVAGTALQVGAVAAVGGLAYKAYQNYRQGKPVVPQSVVDMLSNRPQPAIQASQPAGAVDRWIPDGQHSGETATLLLQAMVAAATADGHLDKIEYGRIRQQLLVDGFTDEEQLVLSQMIMHPSSIDELAAAAKTMEQRVEIYTAARLAIDADTETERGWLSKLAAALKIEPGLKAHVDAIGGQKQIAAA